jgi:hypothetical protein
MPFIVTTKMDLRSLPDDELPSHLRRRHWPLVWRRAIATLDAELPRLMREHGANGDWATAAVANLSQSGGTVGPLPDGTVIVVEPVEWFRLYDESGYGRTSQASDASVLAAFNARQAPSVPELVERSRALGPVMEAQCERVAQGLRDAADRMRDES